MTPLSEGLREREQLLEAAVAVAMERGFEQASIEAISERAGVSEAGFRCHFRDPEDCFLQAFEAVCERFDCQLLPIYLRPDPWRDRIRAAAHEAARFCREHELQVCFGVAESLRNGHHAVGDRSLRLHLDQVDSLRGEVADPGSIPAVAAELAVGSVLELVIAKSAAGTLRDLEDAIPALLYGVYRAYLGIEAARQELALDRHQRF